MGLKMEVPETCTLIYEFAGGKSFSVTSSIMQLGKGERLSMINATVFPDAFLPRLITVNNYLPDPGQVLLFGSSQLLIIYLRIAYSREGGKTFSKLIF